MEYSELSQMYKQSLENLILAEEVFYLKVIEENFLRDRRARNYYYYKALLDYQTQQKN